MICKLPLARNFREAQKGLARHCSSCLFGSEILTLVFIHYSWLLLIADSGYSLNRMVCTHRNGHCKVNANVAELDFRDFSPANTANNNGSVLCSLAFRTVASWASRPLAAVVLPAWTAA